MAESSHKEAEEWTDITDAFISGAKELAMGQLFRSESFQLLDAMNATEIMDPKMDSNVECNRVKRKVLSFKSAVEAKAVKVDDFSTEEIIGIMDELLACLATWLDGQCLAQTVFTCLYLHDVSLIEDPGLKAFCIGIVRIAAYLRDAIFRAAVHEEEDQQTVATGFNFLEKEISDTKIQGMLRESEDILSKSIRGQNSAIKEATAAGSDTSEMIQKNDLLHAALTRTRFCKALLTVCIQLDKPLCIGVAAAKEATMAAMKYLKDMKTTVTMGAIRDRNPEVVSLGFDVLANNRLLPPSPRHPVIMTREKGFDYMDLGLAEMLRVYEATDMVTLGAIHMFCSKFSWRKPFPTILSRSYLICLFYEKEKVFGKSDMVTLIRGSMKAFISPPAICSKSRLAAVPRIRTITDDFIYRCIQPLLELFQVQFYHRSKHRQKYANMFPALSSLQEEAITYDSVLYEEYLKEPEFVHLGCFCAWVLRLVTLSMLEFVLLGLENDLYAVHELHYVFCYADYLMGWLIGCLIRSEKLRITTETQVLKQSKAKGKKKKQQKKATENVGKDKVKEQELLFIQAQQCICKGLLKVIEGLYMEGHLKLPVFEFGSEKLRYEHRFKPLEAVTTPGIFTYEKYSETACPSSILQSEIPCAKLFEESAEHFTRAKLVLDRLLSVEELKSIMTVVKTNLIVVKLLAGGHKKDKQANVTFDFSVHRYYPIVRVA
ncbi:N-alpha-acetyltransferase 35, NatC auxiliary subunit-like [Oscarella lobularis]|uniref:N-alpha-acetyltransferase 35, NatC auxiliary subunit-like n=1 Tax=Oscarella lobularis TaxID=121494 RepID=UPI003313737B